jgi:uncharacterized phage protein (TIGR01671 family)
MGNRNIAFRVWCTLDKRYVGSVYYYASLDKIGNLCSSHSTIIEQNTGLKDKNGIEIYEGDLVKHPMWDYPFEIIFNQEKARFVCKMKTGLTQYIANEELEVIGDVHRNPDMLCVGENV